MESSTSQAGPSVALVSMPWMAAGMPSIQLATRGHVLLVLDGELITELRDGRTFTLGAGDSYVVADGDGAHRSSSPGGARLFIVD